MNAPMASSVVGAKTAPIAGSFEPNAGGPAAEAR
jgi:hypothetical protein